MIDPWAPEPGFERYTGPVAADLAPVDSQTFDLRSFIRNEMQSAPGRPPETETVILPDGMRGELKQRAANECELTIYLGRDFYQVFSGTHSEVLKAARAVHRGPSGGA